MRLSSNTKEMFYLTIIVLGILITGCTISKDKDPEKKQTDYLVGAYVWPSCHDEPRSREVFWQEGIGEWEIIKKRDPRFEGHYQPRVPL